MSDLRAVDRTGRPRASGGGSRRVGRVRVDSWVGMPGARAAEAVRGLGLQPAMELVEADGDVGTVVGQAPQPGSMTGRGALITLFVAAPEGEGDVFVDGPPPVVPEGGLDAAPEAECEVQPAFEPGAVEEITPMTDLAVQAEVEADSPELGAPERAALRNEPVEPVASARAGVTGDAAPSVRETAVPEPAPARQPVGRDTQAGAAPPSGGAGAPRLRRVRWLLVVGGWRVWWPEAVGACLLVTVAAWAVGGQRADSRQCSDVVAVPGPASGEVQRPGATVAGQAPGDL